MKMPEKINSAMLAPCGMNCIVYYKHCYHKKHCAGCFSDAEGKPEHRRKCKIKGCAIEKVLTYCFQYPGYPCKRIKSLELHSLWR